MSDVKIIYQNCMHTIHISKIQIKDKLCHKDLMTYNKDQVKRISWQQILG